jgi:hypothetical protein
MEISIRVWLATMPGWVTGFCIHVRKPYFYQVRGVIAAARRNYCGFNIRIEYREVEFWIISRDTLTIIHRRDVGAGFTID